MLTDHEPSSTRLINIPVIVNNQMYKLLIYTNDLKISNKPVNSQSIIGNGMSNSSDNRSLGNFNGLDRSLEVFSNQYMTNGVDSSKKGALMIVPIPNIYNVNNFGLVDVSSDKMKYFRKELFRVCDRLKPATRGMLSYSNSVGDRSMKKVHKIGNYRISVADNLNELHQNIDWSKFELPSNFNDRFATLQDTNLYPDKQYAYVVAQSQNSIKDDGFGIVYPDVGYEYFPTAHEVPDKFSSFGGMNGFGDSFTQQSSNNVEYDVKIYNLSERARNNVKFGTKNLQFYNLQDRSKIYNLISYLDLNMVMSKSGQHATYDIDSSSKYFNFAEINGSGSNQNLILSY